MKKVLNFFKRYIVLIPLIYLAVLIISELTLEMFDLMYRQRVYIVSAIIIIPLFIIGVFQILLRLKRSRVVLIGLFLIVLIISGQLRLCCIFTIIYARICYRKRR